ncbi:hypothetical protein WBG78_09850 [Chryseolinea sp. T2]|uniref:hypothetical protein n=1 Tax=Chryseolinea sp. T2 TaxID=3129255 RepID=UPI00307771E5
MHRYVDDYCGHAEADYADDGIFALSQLSWSKLVCLRVLRLVIMCDCRQLSGTLQSRGNIARFLLSFLLICISNTFALGQRSAQIVPTSPSLFPHLSGSINVIVKAPAVNGQKTVRFVYLVPSDVAVKPTYTQSIKNAARHLQQWYRDQLGGNKSFRMTDKIVEVHQSTHPSSWYATNPDADWAGEWKFWFNAVNDAFSLSDGRFEDPDNFWVIYVDALPLCPMQQGGGLNGVAAMGANDLRGLTGQPWIPICDEIIPDYSPCRYVGGLGHELGHAFGLPHPAGCDDGQPVACDYNALMYTGYVNYPSTYFSEGEKATLRTSPFITTITGAGCNVDCSALNVEYAITSSRQISICQGDSYFAGGNMQTSAGTYTDRYLSKSGCDSILTTQLTVLPKFNMSRDVSICQGQSFLAGGKLQTASGTYLDLLKSKGGCDSAVTTRLHVLPAYQIIKDVSICSGETYSVGGIPRSVSGTYTDVLKTRAACDSIIVINLRVFDHYAISRNVSICTGETFLAAGKLQTTSGTYVDRLKSKAGCDSIVTTELTVLQSFASTRDVSICQGQSLFAGGKLQTTSGTYVDRLKSKVGCDSVITTRLHVLPAYRITKEVNICAGTSYTVGGTSRTTSGVYTDALKTRFGCDSMVVINLKVMPEYSYERNISICEGEQYLAAGSFQNRTGNYTDVFKTKTGCDSTILTRLVVYPTREVNQSVSICRGDSYFAGGIQRDVSGTYHDNLKTIHGCDSIVTTHLEVVDQIEVTKDETVCAGKSYVIGSNVYSSSGTYRELFSSKAGCDSVVTLHLTVLPQYESTVEINTCVGESYFAGGQLQTTSGTYVDTFKSLSGCDSVVITKLTVGICLAVELPADIALSIYPIPVSHVLHVDAADFDHAVLVSQTGMELISTEDREINIEPLADGLYYVRVYQDKTRYAVKKVLVLH